MKKTFSRCSVLCIALLMICTLLLPSLAMAAEEPTTINFYTGKAIYKPGGAIQEALEEALNVKFGLYSEDPDAFKMLLASGEYPDVAKASYTQMIDWASQGLLRTLPLEMIKQYAPNFYTFRRAKQECANPFPCAVAGLQETDIVELSGGIIWALMRNDLGFQMEAFSMDGGDSWTPPQPSVFTSPPSPISIKRLQKNNALFVVWNPVPNYNTRSRPPYLQGRTPLVCAISLDDGKTWAEPMLLEDDQDRGFCYPAIHELNDGVLISYCGGSVADGGCLCRQIINKVRFDEMDFTVQKTSALYRLPY